MTSNTKEFNLNVIRIGRLLFGTIPIGILVHEMNNPDFGLEALGNDYFVLLLIFLIAVAVYFVSIGKIRFSYSNNEIHLKWKRRIPLEKDIDPIDIRNIRTLVVDNGTMIRVILTDKRKVAFNPLPSSNKEYLSKVRRIVNEVKTNGGIVISHKQYLKLRGYDDLSFHATWMLLAAAIVIIERTWAFFGPRSLIALLMPILAYYRHLKRRIKIKTGGNIK